MYSCGSCSELVDWISGSSQYMLGTVKIEQTARRLSFRSVTRLPLMSTRLYIMPRPPALTGM